MGRWTHVDPNVKCNLRTELEKYADYGSMSVTGSTSSSISTGIISPPCLHAEIKFQWFIALEDFSTSHAIQF